MLCIFFIGLSILHGTPVGRSGSFRGRKNGRRPILAVQLGAGGGRCPFEYIFFVLKARVYYIYIYYIKVCVFNCRIYVYLFPCVYIYINISLCVCVCVWIETSLCIDLSMFAAI